MRGKGEGSLYKRASDGLWVATIELPFRDGRRRRRVLTGKTKRAVVEKRDVELARLKREGDLPTSTQTVEQWLTYWHRAMVVPNRKPMTAAAYDTIIRVHLIPAIGGIRLDKLTAAHVRRVQDEVLRKGRSPGTALAAHRTLSVALNAAAREGRIHQNPAQYVQAPRRKAAQLEALTVEEAVRVLTYASAALERRPYDPYPMRWAVALLTGARRGEVLGLELDRILDDRIDLSWQLQRLPAAASPPADYEMRRLAGGLYLTRPKSSAGWRVIPLVDPLRSALQAHIRLMEPNRYGLLFTTGGRPIDPRTDSMAWPAVLEQLGIDKHVRLHDVRHTTVDLLYEAGVPEALISEIVGHSTRSMTRAYKSRGNLPQLTLAMESMSALLTRS